MPDYQGIGLGTRFLNAVAEIYSKKGYDFSIVSSAKNLISSLRKNNNWVMYGYCKTTGGSRTSKIDRFRKVRNDCYSARFMYKK